MTAAAALPIMAALTFILATLYAIGVHWLKTRDPDHGITPWLVVVGVTLVGLTYAATVHAWQGLNAALLHLGTLALLFIVASIPMILGYYIGRIADKNRPHIGGR